MKNNNWVRGAMLLAVGLVLQALRLVIPMPPMWTVFVVGTLVNMVLVLAARTVGLWPSVMIAVLLPVMAYFSRAAAASVFDTGSGCRQLGDGISVCPLLGKGDHHRRASF